MVQRISHIYGFRGVDYRSPEPLRNIVNAVDGLNFDISPSQQLIKRRGFAMRAKDDEGYGLAVFDKRTESTTTVDGFGDFLWGQDPFGSPSTAGYNTVERELVGLSKHPSKWTTGTFTITYAGAGTVTCTVSATSESDVKLVLVEDGSTVLTHDLGDGTEGSPVDMTALKTAVDAVTDFSATISGTASTPAAFLDFTNAASIASGGGTLAIGFGYWSEINRSMDNLLIQLEERLSDGETDFENASAVTVDGVLYISDGFDNVMKYDGQTIYKAGLPQPGAPSMVASSTTSAQPAGVYKYRVRYRFLDDLGIVRLGDLSDEVSALDNSSSGKSINVTVPNILEGAGYKTNCAIVNGAQTSVNAGTNLETITVDSGHTLVAGDKCYLYDTTLSDYVVREVSSVASTTVTFISDIDINVADNAVISGNLRIQIFRTEAGGSTYKFLKEIPNNSFVPTQVYEDSAADSALEETLVEPTKTPGLPPKAKYLIQWNNQLIYAGDPSNPLTIYWSDYAETTSVENVPAVNSLILTQARGTRITGLGILDRNLVVFTDKSILIAEGNLAQDQVRFDVLSQSMGCVAHATIKTMDEVLYWLSEKGVYTFDGRAIRLISAPLDPVFRIGANNNFRDYWQRAVAVAWPEDQKYLLFLPDESALGSSRVFVYDILNDNWMPWSNINWLGGAVVWDDGNSGQVPWWVAREASTNPLYRMNLTNSELDYADHVSAVDMNYRPQWELAGMPRTPKIFTEMSMDMLTDSLQLGFTPTGDMTVDIYSDWERNTSELSFSVTTQTDDDVQSEALPSGERRTLGLKLSDNTINKTFCLTGYSLEYYTRLRRIMR